ncbi:MAG: DUF4386 family protein [Chitinivibrionales bacterium]|nr:DUF4386 family protein [Chitinivibrionales bacterium]
MQRHAALRGSLFKVLHLAGSGEYLHALGTGHVQAFAVSGLESFEYIWNIGYPLFAIHLCVAGWLVFRSGYVPKVLGVLLVIAGAGYLIDSIGKYLSADYNLEISAYTFLGEPLLLIWLWKLFYLGCRFIGWFLLCILTAGIGFLWLMPYGHTSFALFHEDLKAKQAEVQA